MEIERRGKYPGVKVHLDPDEIEAVQALAEVLNNGAVDGFKGKARQGAKLTIKLDSKIAATLAEDPDLLTKRTEDQIRAVLEKERDSAIEKLAKMSAGVAWNKGKEKGGAFK